jgi:hypothetical protein
VSLNQRSSNREPRRTFRKEHIPANAPRWHSTCNSACHGRKHGTSRTPQSESHIVSLASRVAIRLLIPGLWRICWFGTVTTPSHKHNRQPFTGFGLGTARRITNFHCHSQQFHKHSCDVERERNSGRQLYGWNHHCQRRLQRSWRTATSQFSFRTSVQLRR